MVVLGVDDFALRRGHVYGTVLIDMDTHRPIDLLPDREAATLRRLAARASRRARWCVATAPAPTPRAPAAARRTRCRSPTAGICGTTSPNTSRRPSPGTAAAGPSRSRRTRPTRRASRPDPQQLAEQAAVARREPSALVSRTRDRYAAVQALRAQGKGIKTIMRELGLAKETVRRFARATSVEELLATARDGRPSVLDEFKPYLHDRFNAGHTNGSQLFAEIREQGYRGSLGTVLGYLRPFRRSAAAPPAVPAPPTVRAVDQRDPAPPRQPRRRRPAHAQAGAGALPAPGRRRRPRQRVRRDDGRPPRRTPRRLDRPG